MDFHWIIGQGGERKRGPPCRAPMIGHYSDFVSRISRSPSKTVTAAQCQWPHRPVAPRSFLRPWKGGLTGHASPTKPDRMALGCGEVGRQIDRQKKEWVEEKAAATTRDSASHSAGSRGDELGSNSYIINICEEKRKQMSSFSLK